MNNGNNGTGFFKRFTKIPGISNVRRLTWKGKIRLGVQVPTIEKDKDGKYKKDSNGNFIQKRDKFGELEFHPKDVPHFVCPPEVEAMFGKDPTELDIAFPLSGLDGNGQPDIGGIFPQAYKFYGSSRGLKCIGDGETAMKANEEGIFEEVECPCDKFGQKDGCSKRASLFFFIPSITIGAIYVIDSGSWNTMVDVQSGIYLALELLKDPITNEYNSITMLPFKLRRVQRETQHDKRKDKHWPLTCELNLPIEDIRKIRMGKTLFLEQRRLYQIPEREEVNPKYDSEKEGAVIVAPETEEEVKEEKESGDQKKQKQVKEPIKEKRQDPKKEIEESRAREAKLKKDHEEGKDKLKSYQESKTIYKKRKDEEDKILNEIALKAQNAGINSFEELVNFGLERGIFQTKLTESIAKKVLTTNKDIYDRLMRSLDPPNKEELEKILGTFKEAGLSTWKEIAYFACVAKIKGFKPGDRLEGLQGILIDDPDAINRIIEAAEIK